MQLRVPIFRPRTWPLLIGLLLVLGCALRLLGLESYPLAAHHDELSNIYDGYCLAETGADRWGARFPLILRAFGNPDYRPPLYAWLCAVPIRLFGLSATTGRLVSALLGCASLGLLYLVARRMGGRLFAGLALLLAVVSPWHIIYSRVASEGSMLPPFFLIAACYLWQRAYDRQYSPGSLLLLGLCIGLGTNAYQASKLVALLLALWVVTDLPRTRAFLPKAAVLGAGCLVGAAPQLLVAFTQPEHFFSRAEGSMMPFAWSFQYFAELLTHFYQHLAPEFLFFSFGTYNNLSIGRLLAVEVAVFYLGLLLLGRVLARDQAIRPGYFYLLLFTVVLPSALTIDTPNALRVAGLTVLLPLVSAAGLCGAYRAIGRPALRRGFIGAAVGLILANALYCGSVYADSFELRNEGMNALVTVLSTRLLDHRGQYDAVLVEELDSQMYIYVATFGGVRPTTFQRARKRVLQEGWDEVKQLDSLYFLRPAELPVKSRELPGRKLLVQRQRDDRLRLVDGVEVNGQTVYFYEIDGPR